MDQHSWDSLEVVGISQELAVFKPGSPGEIVCAYPHESWALTPCVGHANPRNGLGEAR